ncbi:hypothetical protein Pth03_46180 [Planotetraspora thailandica]|uniref:non-specific serine/threonine protein kinase n=1 Tax=Planotetraspora thailandica TaxID=487172 RepID=A0A8J3V1Y1_9ACTN|nr:serine/threonine-protein kinase [Planotetraspora thailandica]GII56229.1 hypothetical protein Pth03_46180 [Planotetraspora thailandica]
MNAWPVPGYREERVLGSGRSGQVVLATYVETGALVAIKYLSDELSSDSRFRIAFREHARRMAEFGDPHIVHVYGLVESPFGAAVVMEFVDGEPLRRILDEYGSTSPEAALVILKDSLSALSVAHGVGIVHRDCKPGNVLVQADGFSKLTDFGIATVVDGVLGTPPYMSPEQWNGAPADPSTDIYAATCVFFECLTGRVPYGADHPAALRYLHQSAAIPVDAVPTPVRTLVTRGLAKNPADRPLSARAFISELESTALEAYGPDWERRGRRHLAALTAPPASDFPESAPPTQTISVRTRRRRPLRYGPGVLAGAGALVVGVVVVALVANRQDTSISPASAPQAPASQASTPQASVPRSPSHGTHKGSPTPTPSSTPTPAPVAAKVSDLTIAGFDGLTATIRAKASTPQSVTLTASFAQGASPSTLTAGPSKTFVLTGSTSYKRAVDGGFATPSCGETVYRQVTVSTTTNGAVGAQSDVVAVKGDPCSPPTVSISSWDGTTLSVEVRSATSDPVTLTAAFHQTITVGARTVDRTSDRQVVLSGDSVYDQRFKVRFKTPACGYVDVRKVVVTVDSASGTARDSARSVNKGDACAEPTPGPTKEHPTGKPPHGGEPGRKPSADSRHEPGTKTGSRDDSDARRPRGDSKGPRGDSKGPRGDSKGPRGEHPRNPGQGSSS